ncbi:methylmalonyl-CoA epimerase [Brooklawnia cerclae]|uniref:Methylmalonyl-CoA/ethylmalonyl-CoA epimerase n=1 Tax=Brooklawnia cerclae TaxID=349934 RepID=A0ABX0SI92_9ACTN|nr:methylmalonyl-CoA epimerase [Brooklawnia cerclae]NIH56452.1 methylmalonyl-CoA/ethylmalonyl-CoA epimerase [Brooklawnia cerclae]
MDNSDLFTCIDHVAYACPDADEAVAYYQETFGWHELHRESNDEQGVLEVMVAPAGELTEHMTQIQILAPLRPDSTVGKWLENNRPGLHHMAWRTDDIDTVSATLRSRGVRLLYDEPKHGTHNSRINFIHPKSGKGVLIEIVEPAKH